MSSYLRHMLIFGINVAVIFTLVLMVVRWYVVPFVNGRSLRAVRVNGLLLLTPGVVAANIPQPFATVVAHGNVIAAILALAACWALHNGFSQAKTAVWAYSIITCSELVYNLLCLVLTPTKYKVPTFSSSLMVPTLLILHLVIIQRLRTQALGGLS